MLQLRTQLQPAPGSCFGNEDTEPSGLMRYRSRPGNSDTTSDGAPAVGSAVPANAAASRFGSAAVEQVRPGFGGSQSTCTEAGSPSPSSFVCSRTSMPNIATSSLPSLLM